ncbi:nitrogen fixation/metabolism regulation signal transduction histidine kinase [Hymenobacter luteus]|uniref:histidine kinase n=2 Tax=Hymenobacter TaxID=89966 RepID=A0A7W9T0N5_9BACT|nr:MULTISPECIES: ATP-binding protein [Hymenobacter]MBB4601439.1 nitrogen fixation/metabolism regulation signal transduction histidine kinase [Hymenobacter latericoloratus]MBB6058354.1 nitrogen fixation/metabolism regulation signal transduction histidine kinase [Hymenobacter luteus]
MTLRVKFLLFVTLIHAVLIVLAGQVMRTNAPLFVGLEMLLLTSIILTIQLYRGFVRPFQLIAAGTEAIRARDFTMKFVPVGQREMDQLIDVYNHMIDELRKERVTQHEKSYLLESLIQASPAGVLLLSFDGQIEGVNPAAERMLGVGAPELLGQNPAHLPGDWGATLSALTEQAPQVVQLSGIQTYRAHCSQFIDRGFTRRFIVLEELTQDLIRQEKQAYEKLIRMMSHEINNSIGAINSILQSFHYYAPQLRPDDQADFTEALDVSIGRNTHLANFIANFANLVRLPLPQPQPTSVHELLRTTERLLHVQAERRRVQWHWELAPDDLVLALDPVQLEQALVNICKNAQEAIGENGNIWVRTTRKPAQIIIENDGPGIAPEVQRRLFTPFFSTKRDGRGIGLTLVRDILLQHGFAFSLETQENGRTAFTIRL